MNHQDLKTNLTFLFDGSTAIGLNMYMIMSTDNGDNIKKADLDEAIINDLKDKFLNNIKIELIENTDLILKGISQADTRRNIVYHYDLEDQLLGLKFLKNFSEDEHADLFSFSNDSLRNISGFLFLIGSADEKIALYKKMYPISLMQRDSALMIFHSKTRFVKMEEDILKIDYKYDFLQIKNDLFILNTNTLEKYFGFEETIRKQAICNINLIAAANLVQEIDSLNEMVTDIKFARKIMKLRRNSPVLNLPFVRIRSFIQAHPKLKKKLRFNDDESKISLDTKVSKELFLKLLDDDFLKSELTELLYDSEIKAALENEEVIN